MSRLLPYAVQQVNQPLRTPRPRASTTACIHVGKGRLHRLLPVRHVAPFPTQSARTLPRLRSWLLAAVFIFLQLRPFVESNRVETQRIARMLSELPPDVDIEGLVSKVLLATGNAGRGGAAAAAVAAANAAAAAAAAGVDAGANAAARGASQSPLTPPGGGAVSAAMVLRSIWGPSSPPAAGAAPAAVAAGANDGSVRRGKAGGSARP